MGVMPQEFYQSIYEHYEKHKGLMTFRELAKVMGTNEKTARYAVHSCGVHGYKTTTKSFIRKRCRSCGGTITEVRCRLCDLRAMRGVKRMDPDDLPLARTSLSIRTVSILESVDVFTVKQAAALSGEQRARVNGAGADLWAEVDRVLADPVIDDIEDGDPSPQEIAAMCAKIQAGWSEEERERRKSPSYRNGEVDFEPVSTWGYLPGATAREEYESLGGYDQAPRVRADGKRSIVFSQKNL